MRGKKAKQIRRYAEALASQPPKLVPASARKNRQRLYAGNSAPALYTYLKRQYKAHKWSPA